MVVVLAVAVSDPHLGLAAALTYALAYTLELGLSLVSYFGNPPAMRRALFIAATLALTAPSQAFARGEFDPTHEFELHPWVEIHLGPLDMSINKAVVYLMLGSVITMALGILLMRVARGRGARHAPDDRRADLRSRPDTGRRAGPAVESDRPLVPLRGRPFCSSSSSSTCWASSRCRSPARRTKGSRSGASTRRPRRSR